MSNSRETLHCEAAGCENTYGIENSDANDPTRFCSRECEEEQELELVIVTPGEKTWKVWVEVEEYDEETGEGVTMDSMRASVASFDTYEAAEEFASKLHELGEGQPVNASDETHTYTLVGIYLDTHEAICQVVQARSPRAAGLPPGDRAYQILAVFDGEVTPVWKGDE